MSPEQKKVVLPRTHPQPRRYRKNVHFWLRKVYYYVANLPGKPEVEIDKDPSSKRRPVRDKTEREIREHLKAIGALGRYDPYKITQAEAREACKRLYEIFNELLDEDVLDFIEDPRCPGGRPRTRL